MATVYGLDMQVRIEHVDGPQPDWSKVADAATAALAGTTLEVDGARLVVDDVLVETGSIEEEEEDADD